MFEKRNFLLLATELNFNDAQELAANSAHPFKIDIGGGYRAGNDGFVIIIQIETTPEIFKATGFDGDVKACRLVTTLGGKKVLHPVTEILDIGQPKHPTVSPGGIFPPLNETTQFMTQTPDYSQMQPSESRFQELFEACKVFLKPTSAKEPAQPKTVLSGHQPYSRASMMPIQNPPSDCGKFEPKQPTEFNYSTYAGPKDAFAKAYQNIKQPTESAELDRSRDHFDPELRKYNDFMEAKHKEAKAKGPSKKLIVLAKNSPFDKNNLDWIEDPVLAKQYHIDSYEIAVNAFVIKQNKLTVPLSGFYMDGEREFIRPSQVNICNPGETGFALYYGPNSDAFFSFRAARKLKLKVLHEAMNSSWSNARQVYAYILTVE